VWLTGRRSSLSYGPLMPRRTPPSSSLPPELADAIAAMTPDELKATTGQLLDFAAARAERRLTPERISRRRRRARSPFSVTVRADLVDAKPPIWRRVELPSTLHLDELHLLLQALFGWEDYHLHRFTQGQSPWDQDVEVFLCPYDVEEGEEAGVPACDVRLDEVLAEPGDSLLYAYDYGDAWEVRLVVEQVGEPIESVRLAGGKGVAPPEDSGGIHAWNDKPGSADFDPQQLTDALAEWERERLLPPDLATLRRQVLATPAEAVLDGLLRDADLLAGATSVSETEASEMTRAYAWLLQRVGDGLALTSAGWLPPAVVTAAMEEIGLDRDWIGKNNREDQTWPVLSLRSSAQALGLLRVSKGRLLRTKVGAALTDDALGLWRHIAERAGAPPRDPFGRVATSLLLLAVAAGRDGDARLDQVLSAAGWRTGGGAGVSQWAPSRAAEQVTAVLTAVGAYGELGRSRGRQTARTPTAGARALARVALLAARR
jgi:hypothetical protein